MDNDVIVIMVAGNGWIDLSDPKNMLDFGDNGSLLVGACNHNNGTRVDFSNYNYHDAFINSWGDRSVMTTGYGIKQNHSTNERKYSDNYAGTSSTTPLCSAALALIQFYAIKEYGIILNPSDMRQLINKTGYGEGVAEHIGCRPNVVGATDYIDSLLKPPIEETHISGEIEDYSIAHL
ncbi:MAG: S8 family serine peptidase [Rickettsia endosymbiont of Glossina mortisans submortisans]|nr:S8 family serine peptidase [Rickettsia endosymbiont of Glossina mortisans submortisans]